jgi:RNA polymerase sigma factor (sigma-70 family)
MTCLCGARSRELSFVPARRKAFEAHDAQTVALIRRLAELERLPHGEPVGKLLEHWKWLEAMKGAAEKQRWLELVIVLMLVFEPVRRSVSTAFVTAHGGISAQPRDVSWANREEARMIRHVERERLYDVTREAALEAVFRYPAKPPARFFSWLRETIAQRALDKLRGELPEALTSGASVAEAEAIQNALAGFEAVEGPEMSERGGYREWRARIRMRDVFDVVEEFFAHDPVREACRLAVGRLSNVQREVIDSYFFNDCEVPDIAARRKVSESTVYNQKARAQDTLKRDDVFFSALYSLQRVRDRARAQKLAATYPDGVLPDGRRLVLIDNAA